MEKRLIKRTLRYHKTSYNKHLEALICLYQDYLYIKVDMIYEDLKARETYYESYISYYERFANIKNRLAYNNVSEKLITKIIKVLIVWQLEGLIKFSKDGIMIINGGTNNGK